MVEVPLSEDEKRLAKLFAPRGPEESAESRRAVEAGIGNAEARAASTMKQALERAEIEVADDEATFRLVDELKIGDPGTVLDQGKAERLRAASGADALLRFRITDYGATPRTWRKGVIVFEVASTLAITAALYSYHGTRALAGVYLAEEGAEETAEAFAGFWALGKVGRPVRIEAEIYDLNTGERTWGDSATGLSDLRLGRTLGKVSSSERDAQLSSAVRAAVTKIVSDMRSGAIASRGGR